MGNQSVTDLLPKELLEQIQEYAGGKVIYIPKKKANKSHWGTNTDTRKYIAERNHQIYIDFQNGMNAQQLSEKYFLTKKSIQRILKQERL